MKINLEKNLRAAADTLRSAVEQFDEQVEAVSKVDNDIGSLEAEIERLKHEALTDLVAAQKLAGAQVRLDLLRNQRTGLEEKFPGLVDSVRPALQAVSKPLADFLRPVYEALLEEIGEVLRPYIRDEGRRRQIAADSDSARRLYQTAFAPWGPFEQHERPVETSRRVLTMVDGVLRGECPWLAS